jgi:hypothetical protein
LYSQKGCTWWIKNEKRYRNLSNGLKTKISYFKCLKLLKSMGFKAEKKNPSAYSHSQIKRLNWAKAHKSWTSNNLRRLVFSDKTKISIWGLMASNIAGKNQIVSFNSIIWNLVSSKVIA